jgi:hypothetical protein
MASQEAAAVQRPNESLESQAKEVQDHVSDRHDKVIVGEKADAVMTSFSVNNMRLRLNSQIFSPMLKSQSI